MHRASDTENSIVQRETRFDGRKYGSYRRLMREVAVDGRRMEKTQATWTTS